MQYLGVSVFLLVSVKFEGVSRPVYRICEEFVLQQKKKLTQGHFPELTSVIFENPECSL